VQVTRRDSLVRFLGVTLVDTAAARQTHQRTPEAILMRLERSKPEPEGRVDSI
jgi:hypothetical protein